MSDLDLERGGGFGGKRGRQLSFRRSRSPVQRHLTSQALELPDRVALPDGELQSRDRLIHLIVGDDQEIKRSLGDSCNWYTRYLELNFRHHWHLLRPALKGLNNESHQPQTGELVVVYDFIITVARLFKTKENLALVDIVDELDNQDLLKPQLDEERAIPNQIVFAALGWLSMLYQAVPHPQANKLEVTKSSTSFSGCQSPLVTRKYKYFKQGFDFIDQPLHCLLGNYGDLIPRTHQVQNSDAGLIGGHLVEYIIAQSVCFYTMQDLADLKIEWVTSLALHLELDSGKKTLKLFQFPSFCRLMHVERKANILSRLLNDHAARCCEDVRTPDVPTEDFFQEILLSYRLIFGQDDRSWRLFSRMVQTQGNYRGHTSLELSWDCDPMLLILCGRSSTTEGARQIYDEIDANPPKSHYDPNIEFPFFGKRLLELQRFINLHQPQNIRSLLHDRRDVSVWYTVWSSQVLIAFASCTIILMFLSLAFQVWQVQLAREQLRQGQVL
ncbi:MAG: hypothetical protein M1839_008248 [Geoglossum umbratile]|nr:MAG: hypothetical protein M1839_008248 [Geoglossum umbratile]